MNQELDDKLRQLQADVRSAASMLVAFSGGVDSTLLCKVAHDELGERALAVTACGLVYTREEGANARRLARQIGIRQQSIEMNHLAIPGFAANPPERCYLCKRALFERLQELAREQSLACVAHGANVDDFRRRLPGLRAATELGIRAPLMEAGLNKREIRELSRQMALETWSAPSMTCLATRIPYGDRTTPERLERVAKAERFLRELGFGTLRVRDHSNTARIELETERVQDALNPELRGKIIAHLKALGYVYVSLDLEGYRSGSLDESTKEAHGLSDSRPEEP